MYSATITYVSYKGVCVFRINLKCFNSPLFTPHTIALHSSTVDKLLAVQSVWQVVRICDVILMACYFFSVL